MPGWLFGSGDRPARRRSDLPVPPPRPWPRVWAPALILSAVALVALAVLPRASSASDFIFLTTALIALVVLLGGALTMTHLKWIWWPLLISQALAMAGVAMSTYLERTDATADFPNASDVLYLAAYIPAFIALGVMIHRIYPGRDREAWIDASILTVASASFMTIFLIGPLLAVDSLDGAAAAIAIAYPLLDLVLLSALVWLLIGSTQRTVTLVLIATGFLVSLIADIVRDVGLVVDATASTSSALGVLRLAALVLIAAAAWTPTAESFASRGANASSPESTPRLAIMTIGVLAVPALVAARLWGTRDSATLLLALSAMIIIILAVWRIQMLVSTVQRQKQVTELVLDSAGDGIVGLDREGFVLFANLSARRMLRCRESDLVGHRFHDVAHHERPDGSSYPWQECPMHASVQSSEVSYLGGQRYIRRDGSRFPVEVVLSPLVIDGVVTGAVQSFRDVSEREEVEEIKRQFVSVVSHELRTPLTSIKGGLELLEAGFLGPLNDDQQELVRIAVANSTRLGSLVNDILDLERLDSGRMPLEPERVDAAAVVREAVDAITGAATAAGVRLESDVADTGMLIEVDPHRLIQVLTNLIGNAIKFSERGSAVKVALERAADNVRIRVIDHGRGIPVDRLDHVFERFGQVESGDARRQGGTGLGLPIAKEIVERSGGTISVTSAPGLGSTFTVEFPPAIPVPEEVLR